MLTKEELEHIAKIARISLTEEEMEELLPQFNDIFQLLSRVRKLPLVEAEVLSTADARDEFREDVVEPFDDPDAIVAQFPRKRSRHAEVPPNL